MLGLASAGATRNALTKGMIEEFQIPCPPLSIQHSIANVLSILDDRIILLRNTNETLESIIQALFKSWFVDFDPVRAKSDGKLPEGMDDATAAFFPNAFEESDLGLVPRGWCVQKFEDFIERLSVGKKFDQKSALVSGSVPILDQGKSGIIGFHNEVPSVKASLDAPVIVFANHTCYMRLISFDFSAIQNVLPFIGRGVDTVWTFYATKDRIKFSEYKGHWPDFAIQKTIVPTKELTDLYRRSVDSIVRRIRLNEIQAETLTNLRDTLLPRLISGQLRITDAEAELDKVIA
jgi:type I restriction enzyme S subunit